MIFLLALLAILLFALSLPWLIWAQPAGEEMQHGLIMLAATALVLVVALATVVAVAH